MTADHLFTSESARQAQLKGVETKKRRAAMTPEERALDAIGSKLGRLTDELLNAALGDGDFAELRPETRLTAILRALEWKLGKAPTAPKPTPKREERPIPTGDDLFTNPE